MSYPGRSLLLTIGGPLGTGVGFDEWQTTLHLYDYTNPNDIALPSISQLQTWLVGPWKTLYQNAALATNLNAFTGYAKAAVIGPDGHYIADAVQADAPSTIGGSGTVNASSPQDSVVLSWWSGSHLGDANHGRMYMPWSGVNIAGDGRFGSTGAIATAASAFIVATNAYFSTTVNGGDDVAASIMSRKGTGSVKRIAYARVGDVKDTQRRRRNALEERYATVAV